MWDENYEDCCELKSKEPERMHGQNETKGGPKKHWQKERREGEKEGRKEKGRVEKGKEKENKEKVLP